MTESLDKIDCVHFFDVSTDGPPLPEPLAEGADRLVEQVARGRDLDEVMDALWQHCDGLLPHDRLSIAMLEPDNLQVTTRWSRATYDEVLLDQGYTGSLTHSSLQQVLDRSAVRIIDDLAEYLEHRPDSGSTRLLLREGVRSNITLPLSVDTRGVGFLFFSSRRTNGFTPEHGRMLARVVQRMAPVIEKAWMIRQLEGTNRGYVSMLGFVSHELKSPLAAMQMHGQNYLDGYLGEVDPTARTVLKKLLRIAGYLQDMVGNYLDLSKLESGEMSFNPAPGLHLVEDVVDYALESVTVQAEDRGTTIETDLPEQDIEMTADGDLLRIAVGNLLDNAVKYGQEDGRVRLAVAREDDHVRIEVWNRGVGFTPEQKQKLFKRFSRLKQKGTEDRKGTGLGLYLTWWIVQKHDGAIWAESDPGQWAQFTVRLPVEGGTGEDGDSPEWRFLKGHKKRSPHCR